jgi:hypothetical protein
MSDAQTKSRGMGARMSRIDWKLDHRRRDARVNRCLLLRQEGAGLVPARHLISELEAYEDMGLE